MKSLSSPIRASAVALAAASLLTAPASAQHGKGRDLRGGPGAHAGGDIIRIKCDSGDYRRELCFAPDFLRLRSAKMINQKSNAPCELGRDWGLRGQHIWVDNGCRAEFDLSDRYDAFRGRHVAYAERGRPAPRPFYEPAYDYVYDRRHEPAYDRYDRVSVRTYGPVGRKAARRAVRACSGAAHRFTQSRGGYTAEFVGSPIVTRGPKNALRVTGVVRAERRHGYRTAEAVCTVRAGNVLRYKLVH